jgi:hypothetical protein
MILIPGTYTATGHGRTPLRRLAAHNQLLDPQGSVATAFSKPNVILDRNKCSLRDDLRRLSTKERPAL